MNALPWSSWPSSPRTSGPCCETGSAWPSQQERAFHQLKLYTCHDVARLLSGSVGLLANHCDSPAEYWTPPSMITFVAPVVRTAVTSSCIPAAWYVIPLHVPPSRQQRQASGVSRLLSGKGSLNRSKMTALFPLNAVASCRQNSTE